jgi:primase-polymerase (primpol)-like protein
MTAITLQPDAIPVEMKVRPQWVCWKLEPNKDGNLTKMPYNPRTGGEAP